jgi:quinol monooxygenase YgiN
MIILRITVNAFPEKQKEVTQTLFSMIEPTKKENGCLSYEAFLDIEDNNVFSLIEGWENREDLKQHLRSDRFGVQLGTKSLLNEPLMKMIVEAGFDSVFIGIETLNEESLTGCNKLLESQLVSS